MDIENFDDLVKNVLNKYDKNNVIAYYFKEDCSVNIKYMYGDNNDINYNENIVVLHKY
jgi:hypothetical protein